MQIELIEQHSSGPSVYRDMFPAGHEGFHHLCSFTDDIDGESERYRRIGVDLIATGLVGDVRFSYFDTRPGLGCITELIERRDAVTELFDKVAKAADGWDGREPIRFLN
jgi:methylmalonyl-CoA/ethylmalonyl-CoA epimerase